MSIIIRLQNLPWAANAADIRHFFLGLSIPEGGVHIVGGEKGDAFISFSTDEDARQAMLFDGGCIKEVQIRLLLSSRNEMQKVIETARQQSIQFSQVYIQHQQPPQLPVAGGSLPPLTAKVLPQPQQQQVRPDRLVQILRRHQPTIDPSAMVLMSQDSQHQQTLLQQQQLLQHQQQQQQQLQSQQQQLQSQQQQLQSQHLSPKSSENKDRDDKSHKRTRSKSSRSGGGGSGSRRDRSRSRDRRRRDRSRGRDRSRSRERHRGGGGRNSTSRGSSNKSYRSRSPVTKPTVSDQQISIKPWACQYGGNGQQQPPDINQQRLPSTAGPGTSMFKQFRTPPQPPIIPILPPNSYQQLSQKSEWSMNVGIDGQSPYIPNNDFRASEVYGGEGSEDDEDDRHAEYENAFQGRFNDNNDAMMIRGPPGQDFPNQQEQGFASNRGPRFNKPARGGGHRQYEEFGGGGRGGRGGVGGPRFKYQSPRYGSNNNGIDDSSRSSSRFNSAQDGSDGGRSTRFNPVPHHRDSGPGFDDPGKKVPPRYNDRYRYDVRNTQVLQQSEGLCVEVNNMSSHFSYGDVRKLFEGIHIDGSGIKIQKHRQGVAFVRFDSNHNKNLAMKVDGTSYKGCNIVVKHLDDEAYERDNTDDRPYPSAVAVAGTVTSATPTIVDHVDLVDDDDDDGDNEDNEEDGRHADRNKNEKPRDDKEPKKNNSVADDDDSECNLIVCEKNNTKDASVAKDGDGNLQDESAATKYLKLKQLPITVTEEDVLNVIEGEVRRVTIFPDGEFRGAAIEFHSVDAAEAALKRNDCVLLCSTPAPVLRCSYKEYVQFKRKSGGGGKRFSNDNVGGRHYHHNNHHHQQQTSQQMPLPPPPPNLSVPAGHVRSNCVYLYGLPTTVTNTDITQFFADTSVLPDKIHIMLSKFGRPTGESYCEFSTAQQAHAALSKDHCFMGPDRVFVESISRSDMIQAITKPMQQRNQNQDMPWPGGMRGGMGAAPRPHSNILSPRHHHQQQQMPPQSSYNGGGPYGSARPPQQQYNNNNSNMMMNNGGVGYTPRMRGPNTGPDGFGQPGCVVALDNVPYRADVQEIVDFFDGFELNSQNVIRRFNDFGKPTGEARVNLRNPQEAMRAVRTLQNKPIHNRPVHLTLM